MATDPQTDPQPDPSAPHVRSECLDCPVWQSAQLFGDRREVLIQHEGAIYRLRKTRNGRLILQK